MMLVGSLERESVARDDFFFVNMMNTAKNIGAKAGCAASGIAG